MTEVIQKTNHEAEALANLLSQFKSKDVIEKLLKIYVRQIQEIEDMLYDLKIKRWLDAATGTQLDNLGTIVNEARQGRTDDDYTDALRVRILINISQGTHQDILGVIQGIVGPLSINIYDQYPAGFTANVVDPIDLLVVNVNNLYAFIESAKLAGVRFNLEYHSTGAFTYDSGPGFDQGKYGGAL